MDILEVDNQTPDAEIIRRVLAGEINLYANIVRRYNSYLYKVGRSYGYNHDDVEDLMQETYVNAFTHLKDFEGRASLKTWMVQIMLHLCYHKRRNLSFQNEKDTDDMENESQPFFNKKSSNGNKIVQNLELKEVIEQAVLSIQEDYRMVFSLREITGLSTAETAELLNISETNVKVRLNRAKKMLQEEIGKSYSSSEIFEFNLIYCDGMVERVMKSIFELE